MDLFNYFGDPKLVTMRYLLLKELNSFLGSILGYFIIGLFLVLNGLFLWVFPEDTNIMLGGYASLDGFFELAPLLFLLLIPAVTMRSFSEEFKTGTIQLLLVRPLTEMQIVASKFIASLVVILLALLPTGIYFVSVYLLGNPIGNMDVGATWGSYLGLIFLAAIYTSIGMFASSITDNQVIAFLLAAVLSFFIYSGFDSLAGFFPVSDLNIMITSLGIREHYISISRGVVDSRDIVYFLSVVWMFLFLTSNVLKKRG